MTCEFAYADKLLCKTMIVVISFFVRGLCTSTIRNAGFVNNKNNNSFDTIYYNIMYVILYTVCFVEIVVGSTQTSS